LSSKPISEEISEEILGKVVPGVSIYTEDMVGGLDHEYEATVADLREALRPLGLDITTRDAVNWGTPYPHEAADITKICELQQGVDELRAHLDERDDSLEGTFPQAPGRKAAE
jgi:hypothetical protein